MARWPGLMLPRAANVRMSALLPTADIHHGDGYVSFVPLPDSCTAAYSDYFDHFIGADFLEQRFNAHRLSLPMTC
jgi:hypothetical protein